LKAFRRGVSEFSKVSKFVLSTTIVYAHTKMYCSAEKTHSTLLAITQWIRHESNGKQGAKVNQDPPLSIL
jgi:hypothetical protein